MPDQTAVQAAIRVGRVLGAFGVAGAVKVEPLTDHPARFEPGAELRLGGVERRVEWARSRPQHLVVKLSGLDDRTQAAAHLGEYLEVPAEGGLPAPEGGWYHHQLVGLRVRTESGRDLGRIADVLERPANDVWVARSGRVEVLLPATRDAVSRVDLAAGEVVVADWLFEVEEA